ncbi:MAG: polysaccharide biosynthesis tyrosine autokinase [Bacteroidales bacterium]|nr:polysaccharide biosynthesis tyrosine autokinase [Bacteroidales bacterium]
MASRNKNVREDILDNYDDQEQGIDIREILYKYLDHWKWFVLSLAVCIGIAFFYLKVTPPVYDVSTVIMIKDGQKGGNTLNELSLFEGMNMGQNSTDNEIEVLKSKSLIKNVVIDLGLYLKYKSVGLFKNLNLSASQTPVVAEISQTSLDLLNIPLIVKVDFSDTAAIKTEVNYGEERFSETFANFPIEMTTPVGNVSLTYRKELVREYNEVEIIISNPINVAKSYLGSLSVSATSKTTSIVRLNLKTTNPRLGEVFLNKLIEVYNYDAVEDKNRVANNTAKFIDDRIAIIDVELGSTERKIEDYKRKEGLTDITTDTKLFLEENSEYEKKRVEVETQLNLVKYLMEYVNNQRNDLALIPANVGLSDATLLLQINKYNDLVLERNRLLRTTSENNPVIKNLASTIEVLHKNVEASVESVYKGLLITKNDLDRQYKKYSSQISNAPTQEREFTEIARQQQIKSELFLMLLQKREENALTLAATTDRAKVIDETLADTNPVSPKKSFVFLLALLMGLGIPMFVIYLIDLFSIRFSSQADIEREKLTTLPILGDIPLYERKSNKFVLTKNDNSSIAEAFRILRTNIQFILNGPDKKVVLFTSTVPSEGKTFIAVNTAMSFALLNKKVLLVGLDIRNPRLKDYLNLDHKTGFTNYLSGAQDDIMKLIQQSSLHANLSVLTVGPVPPNPSEQLSKDLLDKAFTILREHFDYIIVDTAPVGLVTDTIILSRVADATMYICRANYSHKNNLRLAEGLKIERKLPNVSLVINGVNMQKKSYGRYGYGYGGHYGYGYGKNVQNK